MDAVVDVFEQAGWTTTKEVTFAAENGLRTRVDILLTRTNADGMLEQFFIEVKNGATAALTRNQTLLYPILSSGNGLTAVGARAVEAGLDAGVTYVLPGLAIFL